jgi:hypothetical protein
VPSVLVWDIPRPTLLHRNSTCPWSKERSSGWDQRWEQPEELGGELGVAQSFQRMDDKENGAMSTVFDVLERGWAQLADDSRLAGELPNACEAAGGAATLGQLERYVRGAQPEDADRILVILVAGVVDGRGPGGAVPQVEPGIERAGPPGRSRSSPGGRRRRRWRPGARPAGSRINAASAHVVNDSHVHPLQRSRRLMPSIRAIRSSSDGHT